MPFGVATPTSKLGAGDNVVKSLAIDAELVTKAISGLVVKRLAVLTTLSGVVWHCHTDRRGTMERIHERLAKCRI
jgi:hypothetical protein